MKVACPTCKREIEWDAEAPWRPFCSDRCRLIDLGAWLSEEHAIPGEPVDDQLATSPASEPSPTK